jgi:sulfatase maturation enzyme AslB (radical SAM superfamily)
MFHVEFEATNHCNTRCLQCPHEVMSRPRGRLEWSTYETVIRKIRGHLKGERFSVSFSGMGEPLLHPLIFRFIAHVSGDAFTSFASNGAALTEANMARLIEAGLDVVYLSFNGADAEVYERMMGGLPMERTLGNLRRAVALANGTRLRINANVSVTKANRDQLTAIRQRLNDEGIVDITYSMCHTRGGSLQDPAVVDTPPIPAEITHCDVLANTLFIDWRGRAFICDHDIHGEHGLGDLVAEPIEAVLDRRQALIRDGVNFKICHECNDALKMGMHLFPGDVGGILRDWLYDVYRDDEADPLSEASPQLQWLHTLYKRENRVDRMVNKLLARGKAQDVELERLRHENQKMNLVIHQMTVEAGKHAVRIAELDVLARQRETRVLELEAERKAMRKLVVWPLLHLEKRTRKAFRRPGRATPRPDSSGAMKDKESRHCLPAHPPGPA